MFVYKSTAVQPNSEFTMGNFILLYFKIGGVKYQISGLLYSFKYHDVKPFGVIPYMAKNLSLSAVRLG